METVKSLRMTSDEAPRKRGGGMRYAPLAWLRRRLLWPALVIGGLLFLYGPVKADWVQPQPNEGVPDSMKAKKSPWGACIASFVIPGVGQFYNGERNKGFLHLALFAAATGIYLTGSEISENESKQNRHVIGDIASSIIRIWSAIDAPLSAKRINRKNGYSGLRNPKTGLVFMPDPRNPRRLQPGVGVRAGF